MTDEFNLERRLLRDEAPITPRMAAKRAGIDAAVAQFEKNRLATQEPVAAVRLMDRMKTFMNRRTPVRTINLGQMLMAGTSIAVLALVLVNGPRATYELRQTETPPVSVPPADLEAKVPVPKETEERLAANQVAPEPQSVGGKPDSNKTIALNGSEPGYDADAEKSSTEMGTGLYAAAPAPAPAFRFDGTVAMDSIGGASTGQAVPMMAENLSGKVEGQQPGYHDQGRDKFTDITTNPVRLAAEEPVSTFSIDADTASYSFVRGSLAQNVLPQKDAVRVEELINYFPYDYAGPTGQAEPFKANATLMPSPWNPDTKLLHIGIKGFALNGQERPKSNLVFLLDTSGSMDEPNKLPLLVNSMKMLVDTLGPEDMVSIVVYAGNAGTALEPTKIKDKGKIIAALDNLSAGGSTAGAEGIRQAYSLAEQNFDQTGINRVILATDGDFNVGITDPTELKSFVERKRETGVYLSVLGFGRGNYNDELMQTLAQNGNGNAAYIDTLNEARKVLVDEATATLFPIAKDVKIQVEFNPQTVSEYRLIGYETRMLNREDFKNDKVDAGEIGSGHTVTAIYEVRFKGARGQLIDPLRYGETSEATGSKGNEYAFVNIRYKLPKESASKLISQPVTAANEVPSTEASFAAAVAGFGQILRGGQYTEKFSYDDVIALAQANKGKDDFGYRAEFINLVRIAKTAAAMEKLQ